METEKDREKLIQEAQDFELSHEKDLKDCRYWILENAAEKWRQAGDTERARSYLIKAAENVTGYRDEIDYRKGLLYERAGELTKAVESFEAAINNWDTEIEGRDLHGDYRDPESGKRVARSVRKEVEELKKIIAEGGN